MSDQDQQSYPADNGRAASGNPGAKAKGDSSKPKRAKRSNVTGGSSRPMVPSDERRVPGGRRHLGRILALQVLYEVDVTDHPVGDVLGRTFEEQDLLGEEDLPGGEEGRKVREHAARLVGGVQGLQDVIDPHIAAAAPAFPVAQLPAIDRNVLRLAIYELLRETEVPVKAAINEAVELAKRFGGDNSGRFVNGVLGTVAGRIGAEGRRDGGAERRRGGERGARKGGGAQGQRGGQSSPR